MLELASLLKTSRDGWFRRILLVAARSSEGPLTEPSAAAQRWEREPLFMPQTGLLSAPDDENRVFGGEVCIKLQQQTDPGADGSLSTTEP